MRVVIDRLGAVMLCNAILGNGLVSEEFIFTTHDVGQVRTTEISRLPSYRFLSRGRCHRKT